MPSLKSVSDSITNARRELEQLDAKLAKYHGSGNRCEVESVSYVLRGGIAFMWIDECVCGEGS